jgi:hypothetical protein
MLPGEFRDHLDQAIMSAWRDTWKFEIDYHLIIEMLALKVYDT